MWLIEKVLATEKAIWPNPYPLHPQKTLLLLTRCRLVVAPGQSKGRVRESGVLKFLEIESPKSSMEYYNNNTKRSREEVSQKKLYGYVNVRRGVGKVAVHACKEGCKLIPEAG